MMAKTTVTPVRGELDWIFQAEGIQRMQRTVTHRAVAAREVKAGPHAEVSEVSSVAPAPRRKTWLCISWQYFWWQMLTQGKKKKHLSLNRRLCDSRILFATSPRSDYISLNALRRIFLISESSLLVWGNDGWFVFSKCHNKNFLISTLIEVA